MASDKPILLPEGASFSGDLTGYLVNDTRDTLSNLTLHASRIDVVYWETTTVALNIERFYPLQARGPIRETSERATYYDVEITLHTRREDPQLATFPGWLGLYPSNAGVTQFSATSLSAVTASDGQIGEPVPREDAPNPDYPHYAPTLNEHLRVDTAGALTYQGRGEMKISGPDLIIDHRDGREFLNTTDCCKCPGFCGGAKTWALISWGQGTLSVVSNGETTLAFDRSHVAWTGEAVFDQVDAASFRGDAHTYEGEPGKAARIGGAFDALAVPYRLDNGELVSYLQLSGDLQTASLNMHKIPLIERAGDDTRWLGILIGAITIIVASTGAATRIITMRRRPTVDASRLRAIYGDAPGRAELEAGIIAAGLGAHAEALGLIAEALEKNPELYRECAQQPVLDELGPTYAALLDRAQDASMTPPADLA